MVHRVQRQQYKTAHAAKLKLQTHTQNL